MGSHMAMVFMLGVLLASPLVTAISFDFYILGLLWPGSYCAQSKCCRPLNGLPQKDFFIQGLQTFSSATGEPVTKCNKTPFDMNEISDLTQDMISYWSNIRCPSSDAKRYWKNQWKTFGVCSGLDQAAYFQTALNLRAEVDLLFHLTRKGIVPDKYEKYNTSSIKSAISKAIGADPLLQCSKDKSGSWQLYVVYICIDRDGDKVIDCPVKPGYTCPDSILFPPFYYKDLNGSSTGTVRMPVSIE